jgi:cytochrome d ubiquinol oxidase subunit II
METLDLPVIWAVVIALAVFMYVVLDGFDLGVGILFPFAKSSKNRNVMMHAIAPVWDGNETWLVLGGASLLAAFPKAFAAFMPSVYMPIIIMLIALVARGVALEFRAKALGRGRKFWDHTFAIGSMFAGLSQGFVLGAFIQGTQITGSQFTGGAFAWLTPFSVLVALAVTAGYALLGATWLIIKSRDELAELARRWAARLTIIVVAAMVVISFSVLLFNVQAGDRWGIDWPIIDLEQLLPLTPVPLAVAALTLWLRRSLAGKSEFTPFFCAIGLFALGFLGLAISLFPYVVPYRMTIWQAAAAPNSQAVLLLGVLVLLPLILTYTGYVYWVFRGKASADSGYRGPGQAPEHIVGS